MCKKRTFFWQKKSINVNFEKLMPLGKIVVTEKFPYLNFFSDFSYQSILS